MADITEAPKNAVHGVGKGIKSLPKPVLIGVPMAVVAFVYVRKVRNKGTAASSNTQNATPTADQGSTAGSSQYVTQPADYGGISNPGGGYGGGYGGYAQSPSAPSGSSDTTMQAQLGDVSSLIGTLFPGGLPLGSGPVSDPFPGQASSSQPVFGVPAYSTAPQTPAPVGVVAAPPTNPYSAPMPVHRPAAQGTVTHRGTITKVTHEHGKTCHHYAGGRKECF